MRLSLTLVDLNAEVVQAWREAFSDAPGVRVMHGSMLQLPTDAWVTPTNARGKMDGGLDGVMKRYFGDGIQKRVQRDIAARHGGRLPVGRATCVATAGLWAPPGGHQPLFLISAPTMSGSSQDVSQTDNVAWAMGAALQAAAIQNRTSGAGIRSIALPGLGAATGRVAPRDCADQMYAVYELFNDREFDSFDDLADHLASYLGDDTPRPTRRAKRKRLLFF